MGIETKETRETKETKETKEDKRYYFPCPLRKNQARIPVTVCHKEKCLFLESENGKPHCLCGGPCGRTHHKK